jgi:hypothetical protein
VGDTVGETVVGDTVVGETVVGDTVVGETVVEVGAAVVEVGAAVVEVGAAVQGVPSAVPPVPPVYDVRMLPTLTRQPNSPALLNTLLRNTKPPQHHVCCMGAAGRARL